ncbi:MAG: hypothetical protein EOP09_12620, partial [Proteobacteria bacterium]
ELGSKWENAEQTMGATASLFDIRKRNVLTGCYIPHPLLSRQAFSAFALDWFVFGNAYLLRFLAEPGKEILTR